MMKRKRLLTALGLVSLLLLGASVETAQAQTVALSCHGDSNVTHEFVFALDGSAVTMDGMTYRNAYPVEISVTARELAVGWHDSPTHYGRSFRIDRYTGVIRFFGAIEGGGMMGGTGSCEVGTGKPRF